MWTSVPQIAVLRILISTSLGPISGTGTCSIQMPGSGLLLTRAFIVSGILPDRLGNDAEVAADLGEGLEGRSSWPSCGPPTSGCGCGPGPRGTTGKKKPIT